MVVENMGVLFTTDDEERIVREAETAGIHAIWCAEGQGRSAFGRLNRWNTLTSRARLGTGIVNVFSRSPATIAQEIATLDQYSHGRARLGLGVAHPGVIEDFHGIPFESPLRRMREYIGLIRRYLAGNGDWEGTFYQPQRVRFWEAFDPFRPEVPIYNAAIGEQNIKLTGELADGWLPFLFPPTRLDQTREWLRKGAERTDRDPDTIRSCFVLPALVSESEPEARKRAAQYVTWYVHDIPGYYSRVLRDQGFQREVEAAANAPDTEAAAEEISDEMLDLLAIAGSPDSARDRLRDFAARYDVDELAIAMPPFASLEQRVLTLRTLAPGPDRSA